MTEADAVARGLVQCREIAGRANANFLHAARLLSKVRQDLFFTTYAAMRVIDDLVDEDFLTLDAEDRASARSEVLASIDAWEEQTVTHTRNGGPLTDDIVAALASTAGKSDLGDWPWHALAGAMRMDAEERGMENWDDFLAYCTGATVAPATVFVYLLAAEVDPADQTYHYRLDTSARAFAEDLAIYCYIVHILRDLAKDVGQSPRLVTIPAEVLASAGLSREKLPDALAGRAPSVPVLANALIERAMPHRDAGHAALRDLAPRLGLVERQALKGLIAIYDKLFARAREDSFALTLDGPALEVGMRGEFLRPDPGE